jgi:hypothetical protein
LFIIEFVGPKQDAFETVNIKRIDKGTLTEQDLGIIKERAKLYAYMLLMLVSNRARLGTLPLICQKNAL